MLKPLRERHYIKSESGSFKFDICLCWLLLIVKHRRTSLGIANTLRCLNFLCLLCFFLCFVGQLLNCLWVDAFAWVVVMFPRSDPQTKGFGKFLCLIIYAEKLFGSAICMMTILPCHKPGQKPNTNYVIAIRLYPNNIMPYYVVWYFLTSD